MKMEPAPWIEDHVVDMEELYTELMLEKIDKKLLREERIQLENYKELFALHNPGMLEYIDIRYYCPNLIPKTKILIKGDPGIGKTSFVKKIAWDWAKRLFVKVSIVFFVFLKFVKPGDFIEDAIIHQRDELQGGGVTRKKLSYILETFGPECLLVLDGLDECALGQNSDVLKVIKGSKFTNCNILLTSRPHSTKEFEGYFDTIISVEGFTIHEARKFASRILDDEEKVEAVLDFNPGGERSNRSVHNVPILLSFLCLLVREDNVDLSNKKISRGEIYFRMVQCLYKKFTLRKGIRFKKSSLVNVLMYLGKLALETLLSGKSELERCEVIEQVGEDIFDYGLLIGEDSFTLTRDMTVDIFVTFPHRSLQEFLGAFYFVLNLSKKQPVNHVDKTIREFLKNPLFSEFCVWLLDESNQIFSFPERSIACDTLNIYVAEQIDAVKVDFRKLERKYPVLSLALGNSRNEIALKILEGALVHCSRIKDIVIELYHPIHRILLSIPPFIFQKLNPIQISNFYEKRYKLELTPLGSPLRFLYECGFTKELSVCALNLDYWSVDALNAVLKVCEKRNRFVYLRVTAQVSESLRSLNLSTLDFSENQRISGNLSELFSHCFPSLHTLILCRCALQTSDVRSMAKARREARLPQLRHLDISFNSHLKFSSKSQLLENGIRALNTLVVRSCGLQPKDLYSLSFQAGPNSKIISELTTLDMSCNPFIKGSLSALLSHYLLHLQIIVLRKCLLNSVDLTSLARACNEGRLPELRHLDISQNIIGWKMECLVTDLSCFPSLINLVLCDCHLGLQDLYCLNQAKLDGKLPRIRHLDISLNGLSGHVGILSRDPFTQREISWGNVICYDPEEKH